MLFVVVVFFNATYKFEHGEHFTVLHRRRKSGKSDFAVSANMAYGQVKLGGLGDAGGEYEDPDKLARSG